MSKGRGGDGSKGIGKGRRRKGRGGETAGRKVETGLGQLLPPSAKVGPHSLNNALEARFNVMTCLNRWFGHVYLEGRTLYHPQMRLVMRSVVSVRLCVCLSGSCSDF